MTFPGVGVGVPWAAPGGVFIPSFSNFRSNVLGLGAVTTLPGNHVLTRASTKTVQTSATALIQGIPINTAAVGQYGLSLSRSATNLITRSEDLTHADWVLTNATINAGGAGDFITDPAGGNTGAKISFPGVSSFFKQTSLNFVVAQYALSIWNKATSGSPQHNLRAPGPDAASQNQYSPILTEGTSWTRNVYIFNVTSGPSASVFLDMVDAVHSTGPSTFYGTFYQLEQANYQEEYIPTPASAAVTSAADILVQPNGLQKYARGRLGIEYILRPKGSIGGSNNWASPRNLVVGTGGGTDTITVDHVTGLVTVTVAGVAYTTASGKTFNRGVSDVRYWVESGGGLLQTVVQVYVDGVVTALGTSGSPQGNWTSTSLGLLSSAGGSMLGCDLQEINYYRAGVRPAWTI